MTLTPFQVAAGVIKTETAYSSKGRWVDAQWVRFRKGAPEKMLGWVDSLGTEIIKGVCRTIYSWSDLKGRRYTALATAAKLYVLYDGSLHDITPIRLSGTLTDPFSTVSQSTVVTVDHSNHGLSKGDYVSFSGADAVVSLVIDGEYIVNSIVDADSYTIIAGDVTNSTGGPGGGSVDYTYQISAGSDASQGAFGYGVGGYGVGTYGTPRATGVAVAVRTWSLDNYGQMLIANPRGGGIYLWNPTTPTVAATAIANAPAQANYALVTEEKMVAAFGTSIGMDVQWSDVTDITNWTAGPTTTAGEYPLSGGSRIVGARKARSGVVVVWSDTDAFAMTFTPTNSIYRFPRIGHGIGLLSTGSHAEYGGVVYWMGKNNFWYYDGYPYPIPNVEDIRTDIFDNINRNQIDKVACGIDQSFGEVWWFYPRGDAVENSHYVVFSTTDGVWTTGTLARSAWNWSEVDQKPYAADPDGGFWKHDTGHDGDGEAIATYLESAPADIQDGNRRLEVYGLVPDFKDQIGHLDLTFLIKEYPNSELKKVRLFRVNPSTDMLDCRAGGRQAAIKLASHSLGGHFRFGRLRFDAKAGGKR